MKYYFHPKAKEELLETIDYYESCSKGLGLEFAGEIYSTIQQIIQMPRAWSQYTKNTRRCLTNRFPFGIVYQVVEAESVIIIYAVMHLNREPDYWLKRLK